MFRNNRKIIVFVKNKLMSLDTVIPILLEMKVSYGIHSEIVVLDGMAYNAIQDNVVLRDINNNIGSVLFLAKGSKVKILRYINALIPLSKIVIGCIKGDKIIHFGHLDVFPFKIFSLLFNKNIYRMQGTAYNFDYPVKLQFRKNNPIPVLAGKNLIICSDDIKNTHFRNTGKEKTIYKIGETRTRKIWVEYINSKSEYYFSKYHADVDISSGFIVFILGGINREFTYNLFLSTIEILKLSNNNIPILIKPHAYTNIDNLNKAIAGLNLFYITYLHPSLLASRARVFISNGFSNTFGDAHTYGVRTIEYVNFTNDDVEYAELSSEELKIRSKVSVEPKYVDYFINSDRDKFIRTLNIILNEKYVKSKFRGNIYSDNRLIKDLLR